MVRCMDLVLQTMRTQRPRNVTCVPPSAPARERNHQLARLALSGDGRAWDLLYEKAIRSVPAAVRRADFQHFFSDWEYRDITDEALARCYDHLERYRGLSQFQWWVLGYAKNILRNRIQRQPTHWRNQSLLERAADQCSSIALLMLARENESIKKNHHAYLQSLHSDGGAEYEAAIAARRKQYLDRLSKTPQ